MHTQAVLAGGCFWGEKAWGAFARLIANFCKPWRLRNSNEWTGPVRIEGVLLIQSQYYA